MAKKFEVKFRAEKCKGCELCATVCPKKIISVNGPVNQKGYRTPQIEDMDGCIGCTSCALMCPDGAISIYEKEGEE